MAYCKVCIKEYVARKHQEYKADGNKAHRKYKQKCIDYIRQQKDKPCTDCGIKYPYYVMQFDHLRDKKHAISQMYSRVGLPAIKKEIAKCEVVCANCHAERTHGGD